MIPLIKINMLPYREQQDKQKKSQFTKLMIFSGLLGVGLLALVYVSLSGMIMNQESRNQQLTDGIAKLDEQIKEVQTLEAEKQDFLNRKAKVEELENKRFEAARMIDSLNAVAPEGIYLTAIKAQDVNSYTLIGKATSDSKIADFMRVIPTTNVFNQPTLESINKVDNVQEFSLSVEVSPSSSNSNPTDASITVPQDQEVVTNDVSATENSTPSPNVTSTPTQSDTSTSSPAN